MPRIASRSSTRGTPSRACTSPGIAMRNAMRSRSRNGNAMSSPCQRADLVVPLHALHLVLRSGLDVHRARVRRVKRDVRTWPGGTDASARLCRNAGANHPFGCRRLEQPQSKPFQRRRDRARHVVRGTRRRAGAGVVSTSPRRRSSARTPSCAARWTATRPAGAGRSDTRVENSI